MIFQQQDTSEELLAKVFIRELEASVQNQASFIRPTMQQQVRKKQVLPFQVSFFIFICFFYCFQRGCRLTVGHFTLHLAQRSKKGQGVISLFASFLQQLKYLVTSYISLK